MAPMMPTGPRKTSPKAIMALVFGVLSFGVGGFGSVFGNVGFEDQFATPIPFLGVGFAIAAIVLGAIAIKEINNQPYVLQGKGMAIAGLVLGIVFLSLIALAVLFVFLIFLVCLSACGNANNMIPFSSLIGMSATQRFKARAVAAWQQFQRDPFGVLFRHHPDCAAFGDDTIGRGATRLCAGCTGLIAGTLLGVGVLLALGPGTIPALWLLVGGFIMGVASALPSAFGQTRDRASKIVSKAFLGLACAAVGASYEWLALDFGTQILLTVIAGALAFPLFALRWRQVATRYARHAHGGACVTS